MNILKRKMTGLIQKGLDLVMGSGLMQDETTASGERYITPGMPQLIRQAGAESCVLLKNDGVLPLDKKKPVAVFGRCQLDWFYVGYGSGGDVHAPYHVDLMEGLKNAGAAYDSELASVYENWTKMPSNEAYHGWWGHWPYNQPEMPLDKDTVNRAAGNADTAVIVIGRAAGEDRENKLEPGSYYLTDEEKAMIGSVTSAFKKTVVILNIGNIIDMSWTEEYGDRISAILIAWLGGMESGNSVCDVLYGKVSPCGKLPCSIAREYEDYPSSANFGGLEFNNYDEDIFVGYRYFGHHPEKLLWSFGYGLSYTSFSFEATAFLRGTADLKIKNTGDIPGKEVAALYVSQPAGRLPKAKKVLVAFAKTKELQPGESQSLRLEFDDLSIASYDEAKHAFILEPGEYSFELNGKSLGSFVLDKEELILQCEAACTKEVDLKSRILERLPKEISCSTQTPDGSGLQGENAGQPGKTPQLSFSSVIEGNASLDDFVAGLANEELEALSRGHGMMNSPLGAPGNAGVFGGVIPSLAEKGVPAITCCDGPAGLRMKRYCSLIPCGTALAATWNTKLVEKLHVLIGEEMKHYGVDVQLAPGMNIHRNPLCGRNFEYFSEDPLLSGKTAAAVVKGVQSTGKASCPKHFACNNQEVKRNTNDSRVSERALREIYLRNFEIVVKEAKPLTIMTSYNKINGVWSHYNYDLVTTVLRKEWGFDGVVMTDWWMRKSASPEFPELKDNAYRVRAQVDLLMPGDMGHVAKKYRSDGSLLKTLGKSGGITLAELQRTAKNTLEVIIRLRKQEKA